MPERDGIGPGEPRQVRWAEEVGPLLHFLEAALVAQSLVDVLEIDVDRRRRPVRQRAPENGQIEGRAVEGDERAPAAGALEELRGGKADDAASIEHSDDGDRIGGGFDVDEGRPVDHLRQEPPVLGLRQDPREIFDIACGEPLAALRHSFAQLAVEPRREQLAFADIVPGAHSGKPQLPLAQAADPGDVPERSRDQAGSSASCTKMGTSASQKGKPGSSRRSTQRIASHWSARGSSRSCSAQR